MVVYLIHFARSYWHAQHYLGSTDDLQSRLDRHARGFGSPLIKAVVAAGISFWPIRTWRGGRPKERRLKKRHNSRDLCPICNPSARRGRQWQTGIL
jgi:predicted GIY-YIG superfamily endonuclease